MNKLLVGSVAGAVVLGLILGFILRPVVAPDSRIGELEGKLAESDSAVASLKKRAEGLDKDVEKLTTAKKELEAKVDEAKKAEATRAGSEADEAAALKKDIEAVQARLKVAAVGAGTTLVVGDNVHLALPTAVLFKPASDELTPNGVKVLEKVVVALKTKELAGRPIGVQGHSDGSAPPQPPPPPKPAVAAKPPAKAPPPKKPAGKPAAKPAPPPAPPPVDVKRVTNWEFSAERAAVVVRYLQDKGKIEANRLAIEAFGPYRARRGSAPSRIEIVVAPKPKK